MITWEMPVESISVSNSNQIARFFKIWLKQFPAVVNAKRKVWDRLIRTLNHRHISIVDKLKLFSPRSAGPWKTRADLTLLAANQIFPLLVEILQKTDRPALNAIAAENFPNNENARESADQLKLLFDRYGSDKSTLHNYHHIYGTILQDRYRILNILEIGIGTNNTDIVSHMCVDGKPGASLRALKEFLPNAQIYGADIDKRILFEEERIKTFFVDQTDLSSFDKIKENINIDLDLIIDDGLHSPNANIAVLIFSLDKLGSGGWLVIEDIRHSALPVWQLVASLLPRNFEPHLISAEGAFVFAVKKTSSTTSGRLKKPPVFPADVIQ